MRAIVPAIVLLVIGLTAALPFRRPSPALLQTTVPVRETAASVPGPTRPSTQETVSPLTLTTSQALTELTPKLPVPKSTAIEQIAPPPPSSATDYRQSDQYQQFLVPLQQPSVPATVARSITTAVPHESLAAPESPTGEWQSGLLIPSRTLPSHPSTVPSPQPEEVFAIPTPTPPTAVNARTAAVAREADCEVIEVEGVPAHTAEPPAASSLPAPRQKHYIREPVRPSARP